MNLPARIKVLVLDDQEHNCELIKSSLQSFCVHCDIYTFTDPDQAKRFCLRHQDSILLFITNIFLGGTTAFAFINELQVQFPVAIQDTIILTGADTPDILRSCHESGVHHVLVKPYQQYQLELAVRAIVHKYTKFAPRLLDDGELVAKVLALGQRRLKTAAVG